MGETVFEDLRLIYDLVDAVFMGFEFSLVTFLFGVLIFCYKKKIYNFDISSILFYTFLFLGIYYKVFMRSYVLNEVYNKNFNGFINYMLFKRTQVESEDHFDCMYASSHMIPQKLLDVAILWNNYKWLEIVFIFN